MLLNIMECFWCLDIIYDVIYCNIDIVVECIFCGDFRI